MFDQLVQQSDRLSDMMTSFANKKQEMLQVLADKERIIDDLQTDTAKCKVELEDAKDIISQQKLEQLSVEQKLADNEQEMINLKEQIRVKDETLAELKEALMLKKESQEQLEKVSNLQKEVAVKEGELAAAKNEMSNLHHQLLHQSDLLSATMTSYADKKQPLQYELADKEKIIDELQADNEMYKAEFNDNQDFIQQLKKEQLSMKQELDDKNEEMIEKMRVKDEMLVELKDELILNQNHFDAAVSRQSYESEELQKVTQEQSEKISTLHKDISRKEKELVVKGNEMCELHHGFTQQSDDVSVEMAYKQTMKHELADKERIINTLQTYIVWYKAESNDAKNLMEQLKMELLSMKQELAENEKEMTEKLRVKEVALAKLKEELTMNQNSLDVAISRHSVELEECQKQNQEQLDKIAALQQEVTEKKDDLAVTIDKMSQLNDLLSAEMAEKQKIQDILSYKERMVDKLQAENAMYKADLSNAKDLIQQLKFEHIQELDDNQKEMIRVKEEGLAELKEEVIAKQNFDVATSKHSDEMEELQKITQEQMDKTLAFQKEIAQKEEELFATRNKMSDLHCEQSEHLRAEIADKQTMKHELADKKQIIDKLQVDITIYEVELGQLKMKWSSAKQELVDGEKEMMEKIRVKDKALAKLREELIMNQNCLDGMNITRQSNELEEWQKESQEQLEKISTLQEEVAVKKGELPAAKNEMSNLHHQLSHQSDLLSATMTSYADKQQAFQYVLADKEKIIDELQVDNERYKVELNDAKDFIQQLKMSHLSEKQELADSEKEMMEEMRIKDEALAELLIELVMKQNCLDITVSRHSIEMEKWQKEGQEQSNKILTLQNEIVEREELVVIKKKISELNDQLTKQSDLLSAEMADKQKLQNVLASKEKINWRVVDKLEADKEMYEAQLIDAKDLIQQLKMEQISTNQQLADNQKEMMDIIEVKEEALTELKKELTKEQNSFDIFVSRHSDELEELQKVTQEQVLTLQKSIAEKDEGLVETRDEISDLHHQLAQQFDLFSAEIEEKQTMKHELTDKERIIDMLQADIAMYKVELNNAKDCISQLKMEQLSMKQEIADNKKEMMEKLRVKDETLAKLKEELVVKQDSLADMNIIVRKRTNLEEWQKESQEQLEKIVALQQEVEEKGEELVTTKSEMSNLHHQMVQQSDVLSATMTSYAEKEQTLQSVLADKERIIYQLQSDVEMYTAKLNNVKDSKQQLKTEQLSVKQELEKEMIEKIRMQDEALAELKEQLTAKQSILDAAVSRHSVELREWQNQNAEQSDKIVTLQQEVTEKEEELDVTRNDLQSAAYIQSLKHTLADKERIIDQLKEDIATYQTEANDIKYHTNQLEKEYLSVKQELDDNRKEMTGKMSVKNEALGKLKEKLFAKQNSLVDASIVKKQSIELDMLQMKNRGQLEKIQTLRQEVYKKREELSATKDKMFDLNCQLTQQFDQKNRVIADKDTIIKKLKAEIEMYKAGSNDAKGLMSQSKVEQLSVKPELVDNTKKEMLESRTQTEARAGASVVQSKEKQPNQAKVVKQETKRKEGRVITNRNEPAQRYDGHTSIVKESCKEVSHQNCILAV